MLRKYSNFTVFVLLGGVVLLTGCATVRTLQEGYKAVNVKDGVDTKEATLIAQHQLLQSGKDKTYGVFTPKILNVPASREYSDYWFVDFSSSDYFNRPYWAYLTVISKKDGAIKYSGEYVPLATADFEFVFNPSAK